MKKLTRIVTLTIWVVLSGCHSEDSAAQYFDKNISPFQVSNNPGNYSVGRVWEHWRDPQRKERELSVFLYYPLANANQQPLQQPVLPTEAWQRQHFEAMASKLGGWAANKMAQATFTGTSQKEKVQEKHPVILFSPGMGWLPTDYSELILPLVRKGYIVVALAGQPVSQAVQFPDQSFGQWTGGRIDRYALQAEDMLFAVQQLERLNKNSSWPLAAALDLEKVAAVGHSISGAATLLTGSKSAQIKALVNLDGDVIEAAKSAQPTQPILYITTQPDDVEDLAVEQWGTERNEKRRDGQFEFNSAKAATTIRLKVPGMLHGDFLDAAHLPMDSIPTKYRNRFGPIGGKKAGELTVNAVTTFLNTIFFKQTDWAAFQANYKNVLIQMK
ncbi:alpha/beta hydrolase family protein [Flavisolibacter tropicus]|uniref:Alpha/beta hydrolase n=1 Tax=Flavisolibacter tropicus TaxID=1492898 RepID=A0A172TZW8_9BACT|nr:alpha/beta hydrolase [Flavisolibacter tropicus]ANE52546.1 hypothetical protein SY85_20760 [Flavisolibacter tropicus]